MTLNELCEKLKVVAPYVFEIAESDGIEIMFTDGYCQVLYEGEVIGANDKDDEGGWDKALELALEWLKKNICPVHNVRMNFSKGNGCSCCFADQAYSETHRPRNDD